METVMFREPIRVYVGDTITINYTTPKGERIDRVFHSFDRSRVFDSIIVGECSAEDLDRFGITDGFMMILANRSSK